MVPEEASLGAGRTIDTRTLVALGLAGEPVWACTLPSIKEPRRSRQQDAAGCGSPGVARAKLQHKDSPSCEEQHEPQGSNQRAFAKARTYVWDFSQNSCHLQGFLGRGEEREAQRAKQKRLIQEALPDRHHERALQKELRNSFCESPKDGRSEKTPRGLCLLLLRLGLV